VTSPLALSKPERERGRVEGQRSFATGPWPEPVPSSVEGTRGFTACSGQPEVRALRVGAEVAA
jgi:hypothetical protein